MAEPLPIGSAAELKAAKQQLMSISSFALKLGGVVADRTIRDWISKGILSEPVKGTRGKGDHWVWVQEIIQYYQRQANQSEDQLRDSKIRSENARAKKMEIQIAESEGELVRAADVVATWSAAFSVCKARFMGLAVTLTDDLVGITDQAIAKEIIQDAIQEILEELGDGGIVSRPNHADEDSSDGAEASAETDS
jgi:phage terminase Nu1 subunit (DNA packaging protein)